MILLDTNVLSALMRKRPDPTVVVWLDGQAPESGWTTAVTVFEIRLGIDLLSPGRRRRALEGAFDALLRDDLGGRIAGFDSAAGQEAGKLAAGSPFPPRRGARLGFADRITALQAAVAEMTSPRGYTTATSGRARCDPRGEPRTPPADLDHDAHAGRHHAPGPVGAGPAPRTAGRSPSSSSGASRSGGC